MTSEQRKVILGTLAQIEAYVSEAYDAAKAEDYVEADNYVADVEDALRRLLPILRKGK